MIRGKNGYLQVNDWFVTSSVVFLTQLIPGFVKTELLLTKLWIQQSSLASNNFQQ